MNVRESDELNREVRKVLKTLDVKWADSGHMLRTANNIVMLYNLAIKHERERNVEVIRQIRELVSED